MIQANWTYAWINEKKKISMIQSNKTYAWMNELLF